MIANIFKSRGGGDVGLPLFRAFRGLMPPPPRIYAYLHSLLGYTKTIALGNKRYIIIFPTDCLFLVYLQVTP